MRFTRIFALALLVMSLAGQAVADEVLSPREVSQSVAGECHGHSHEVKWTWAAAFQNQERRLRKLSILVDGAEVLSVDSASRAIGTLNRWMVPEYGDRQSAPFLQYIHIGCGPNGRTVAYSFFMTRDYWHPDVVDIIGLSLPDGAAPAFPMTVFRSGRGSVSAEAAEIPARSNP